jgi:hypothetical protein
MSSTHPASRITPFGSAGEESPKFGEFCLIMTLPTISERDVVHTPGSNMRIANRRPDGVWEFADPNGPFTPAGISDLDLSPSSSFFSRKGILVEDLGKMDHDGESLPEMPRHFPPPPAYTNEPNSVRRHSEQ